MARNGIKNGQYEDPQRYPTTEEIHAAVVAEMIERAEKQKPAWLRRLQAKDLTGQVTG